MADPSDDRQEDLFLSAQEVFTELILGFVCAIERVTFCYYRSFRLIAPVYVARLASEEYWEDMNVLC